MKIALIVALLSVSPFGLATPLTGRPSAVEPRASAPMLYPLDGRRLANEDALVESVYAKDGPLSYQHGELSVQARQLLRLVTTTDGANSRNGPRISTEDSKVSVWVIPTDEELMIARHTAAIIQERNEQLET